MTSWRTSAILGLLLLAAPAPGAADEPRPLPSPTAQVVNLSSAVDFGDGPRLPLTPLAARLGAIVTITGEHVNIVRPDGSELRLKGSPPDEIPVSSDRPTVLLRRGEAWADAGTLAQLLGVGGDIDTEGATLLLSALPSENPSFTSFAVVKPVVLSDPPERAPEQVQPRRRLPDVNSGREDGGVMTELAPVEVGLGVTEMSSLNDPAMTGFYQEIVGPGWSTLNGGPRELRYDSPVRRTLSYFSLDLYDGDRTYMLGDISDPLFGAVTGIDIRSDLNDITSVGAAVMVPNQQLGANAPGQFALRAQTASSTGLSTEVSIAADGSYLLSGEWKRPGASLSSHLIDCYGLKRRDLAWELQALPAVNVFSRIAETEGSYTAGASLAGIQWRLGRSRLGLERARGTSSNEPWGSDALSLSLLSSHTSGTVRYLRPSQPTGREGLEWYLSRFDARGRQVFFSSSAPNRGEWDSGRSYRLGTSLPLRRELRVRAALDWDRDGVHPEGKIEWRPSKDKVIALRYGVFDSGLSGAPSGSALVLQASIGFGSTGRSPQGTGRIIGRVNDDRGQGVADVAVVLEEVAVTFTRADGTFEFRGVEAGRQTVRIDPDRLHADLGGALRPRVVYVRDEAAERADFVVTRLCRISGVVYVQSESGEQREPLVGALLELSDLRTATTDSEGRYAIAALEPGRYTITLGSTLNASLLAPVAPTSWSFSLAPGDRVDGANFAFERRERPIIFEVLRADN